MAILGREFSTHFQENQVKKCLVWFQYNLNQKGPGAEIWQCFFFLLNWDEIWIRIWNFSFIRIFKNYHDCLIIEQIRTISHSSWMSAVFKKLRTAFCLVLNFFLSLLQLKQSSGSVSHRYFTRFPEAEEETARAGILYNSFQKLAKAHLGWATRESMVHFQIRYRY